MAKKILGKKQSMESGTLTAFASCSCSSTCAAYTFCDCAKQDKPSSDVYVGVWAKMNNEVFVGEVWFG